MGEGPETRAEVVVVGGGVIGLAIAFELACRNRRAVVLERFRVGSGASQAAGGMLAPVSEADIGPRSMITLGRDSLARYPDFLERVERLSGKDCRYRGDGTLWVATHRDEQEELDHLQGTLVQKGLQVTALDADALLEREPHLSSRVLSGLLVGSDHQVDPRALCQALEKALRAMGGAVACGMEVTRIDAAPGAHVVRGQGPDGRPFEMIADQVVLAAGAWSGRGLHPQSARIGLRPVKGQLLRLHGPRLLRHVVRTPDVYLIPRPDGELLVGATMEEAGFDGAASAGAVMDLLRHGWQVLPGIYDLDFNEVSVGLRSAVDDHLPVIGRSADGLFLAYGHYRNGILLAPATAHHLSEWLVGGEEPAALEPFTPARFDAPPRDRVVPVSGSAGRSRQPRLES